MPADTEIKIFNDLNANGIFEPELGEKGIKNVRVRLISSKDKKNLKDQKNGGNAHTEQVSDENGIVLFTGVPQSLKIRAKVTGAPKGAIPTVKNAKDASEETDSDLGKDGISDQFWISEGTGVHTALDLGYRMPESVIVRVWNDANSNGLQDVGEAGIAGGTFYTLAVLWSDGTVRKLNVNPPSAGSTRCQVGPRVRRPSTVPWVTIADGS